MPVLPLVASIRVSPGLIRPRCSACMIIDNAGRSLTEPAGLLPSSLARITLPLASLAAPGMRLRRTRGVLPTEDSSVWKPMSIGGAKQGLYIRADALLHVPEIAGVAGATQVGQVCLRIALVLPLQGGRHRNVFDGPRRNEFR